jgi:geranylgeranyl diphosphate synthase type II
VTELDMPPSYVDARLAHYRALVMERLLAELPTGGAPYLYDVLPAYPARPGKGLRAALCLATCAALGGSPDRALNSAVAVELFHNAFLVHDDIQDESGSRRGAPTLHEQYGRAIALNVGNALNLVALGRVMANRGRLGSALAWRISRETELMLRHTLEGQAIELGWIRDNVCDLTPTDYYRMCLKKTSWYTCIYPCRLGAVIGRGPRYDVSRLDRYGWYLGAAFQIQDDLLNLVGDYARYGKEIDGDLWEGKRTLVTIHLLATSSAADRLRLVEFLGRARTSRTADDVRWVHDLAVSSGSVDVARQCADDLAAAARREAEVVLADAQPSDDADLLLALPEYAVARDH